MKILWKTINRDSLCKIKKILALSDITFRLTLIHVTRLNIKHTCI